MKSDAKIKKYSLAEVSLLCIFALSLLIGRYVVIKHRRIQLSDPVELGFVGISTSVPIGPGWEGTKKWQYYEQNNNLIMTSRLKVGRQIAAIVQWRYLLAPEKLAVLDQLSKRVTAAGAEITNTGQINCGNIMMEWAQAKVPGGIQDVFFGLITLQCGRAIELEAIAPADPDLAHEIFVKVAMSLNYIPNDLSEKGGRFLEQVKESGASKMIESDVGPSRSRVYMVDNDIYDIAGFSIDSFENTGQGGSPSVKAKQLKYIRHAQEWFVENASFECNENLDEFLWQNKYNRSDGESVPVIAVELSKDGLLRVVSDAFYAEKVYWPVKATVAKILLDPILTAFVDSSFSEIVLDIVYSNGIIIPTLLTRPNPEEILNKAEDFSYVVRLDFLGGEERYQLIFFDSNKRIFKKLDKKQHIDAWYRSDRKTVHEKFKDSGEYVEQILRMN
jgi:hypothetical protein